MGKDPTKPRGKMSSYAYFVQTCREEHKKKHPDASVNFAEFSKKCSERWKTMSAKEKGKFEDLAKQDKARYEREMMSYVPARGGKKKKKYKDPNAPKRPPSAFFIFCGEFRPKIKGESPGLTIGDVAKKLGEMWNNTSAEDKQPYEKKASKLKEKYEKVRNNRISNPWAGIKAFWSLLTVLRSLTLRTSQRTAPKPNQVAERRQKPLPRLRRRMMMMMTRMKMKTRRRMTMRRMMTSRRLDKYSGHFLVYKAFSPLVHNISIQGVKKTTKKAVYISCFYAVQVFFFSFLYS
uniref:High mobility group protein B2 n=1 Tax=Gouania willdenowi TaxID=441366 RepID=A0A8C5E0V9_GOUWI